MQKINPQNLVPLIKELDGLMNQCLIFGYNRDYDGGKLCVSETVQMIRLIAWGLSLGGWDAAACARLQSEQQRLLYRLLHFISWSDAYESLRRRYTYHAMRRVGDGLWQKLAEDPIALEAALLIMEEMITFGYPEARTFGDTTYTVMDAVLAAARVPKPRARRAKAGGAP